MLLMPRLCRPMVLSGMLLGLMVLASGVPAASGATGIAPDPPPNAELGAKPRPGSKHGRLRAKDVSPTWRAPHCFAWSDAERGYACLDAALGADAGVPRLMDFERWPPPPDTAWEGRKGVVLLAERRGEIPISHKDYDTGSPIVREQSPRAAVESAIRRGYHRAVTRRSALPAGRWRAFRGVWLRFDTRLHEGDASFENHGSLRMSCQRPHDAEDGMLLVAKNQAETAVAFAAPGARVVVVGFVEVDGGEGSAYYETSYLRIDPREHCPA